MSVCIKRNTLSMLSFLAISSYEERTECLKKKLVLFLKDQISSLMKEFEVGVVWAQTLGCTCEVP